MPSNSWPGATMYPHLAVLFALALLGVGCVSCAAKTKLVCTPQGVAVLNEIADGSLDSCAPATAQWERELARDCGWVTAEDFAE